MAQGVALLMDPLISSRKIRNSKHYWGGQKK